MILGIDPGHGGHNLGTHEHGLIEKDYTLMLSDELNNVLRAYPEIEVFRTRMYDETVSLKERGERTVDAECDFLVSLHVNAIRKQNIHGMECYFLAYDKLGRIVSETISAHAPDELKANQHGGRIRFAYNDPDTDRDDWLQAPINVLAPHVCPSVLVEVGYASNPSDRSFMLSRWGRAQIASAICQGIFVAAEQIGGKC